MTYNKALILLLIRQYHLLLWEANNTRNIHLRHLSNSMGIHHIGQLRLVFKNMGIRLNNSLNIRCNIQHNRRRRRRRCTPNILSILNRIIHLRVC